MAPIVRLLEGHVGPTVTSAAADAVRAMALNNDANKASLREAWALPQLVKLLSPEVRVPAWTSQNLFRSWHATPAPFVNRDAES